MGTTKQNTTENKKQERKYKRPAWVKEYDSSEQDLCPDCFKVVGEKSRYNVVCMLGKIKEGLTVGEIAQKMNLKQPTITHHLQILNSVNAVFVKAKGKERYYKLNRKAHCFEECKIPY